MRSSFSSSPTQNNKKIENLINNLRDNTNKQTNQQKGEEEEKFYDCDSKMKH